MPSTLSVKKYVGDATKRSMRKILLISRGRITTTGINYSPQRNEFRHPKILKTVPWSCRRFFYTASSPWKICLSLFSMFPNYPQLDVVCKLHMIHPWEFFLNRILPLFLFTQTVSISVHIRRTQYLHVF